MNKAEVTGMILAKKKQTGITWASMAEAIGMSEVFTTSACLGMNSMPRDKADKLATHLGLPQEAGPVLAEFPTKMFEQSIPTDPCIYRLYEIVGVYGQTLKELIQEKGGDGIMSAIDFEMYVEKIPDPKGDRIEIKMSGKFLPYKNW
ncbi:Cyanate hydratase [Candidatus Filomicrobium marinum]|uniref:Cyanate hydratase n=1 Tax=Candidatus Filomicrobium marinum TaxID=1608628 RepID=A0A0D6JFS0_9HYPH|nr:cyanase [Candidatus Filomicrobium marinum]CFX28184.1 Cyanate hydratase [Candidatus Filomicrobium marinum]CPR19656.1 Cyanate hydratase [Candidatus Filomicrobium marinum]